MVNFDITKLNYCLIEFMELKRLEVFLYGATEKIKDESWWISWCDYKSDIGLQFVYCLFYLALTLFYQIKTILYRRNACEFENSKTQFLPKRSPLYPVEKDVNKKDWDVSDKHKV